MTSDPADGRRWTADAVGYDAWFDRPWGRYASEVERRALGTAVEPPVPAVVLDIGCGSGRIAPPGDLVIGIDRDPGMLRLARGRLFGLGVAAP